MDEEAHEAGADDEADAGDEVEEEDFADAAVSAGFEDPEDVDDIGGEVGEDEGDAVVDHGIAGADANGEHGDIDMEEFGDSVGGVEGREKQESAGVEQDDIHDGGDAAGDGVLDELDEGGVLSAGELGEEIGHKLEELDRGNGEESRAGETGWEIGPGDSGDLGIRGILESAGWRIVWGGPRF